MATQQGIEQTTDQLKESFRLDPKNEGFFRPQIQVKFKISQLAY